MHSLHFHCYFEAWTARKIAHSINLILIQDFYVYDSAQVPSQEQLDFSVYLMATACGELTLPALELLWEISTIAASRDVVVEGGKPNLLDGKETKTIFVHPVVQ